MPASTCWPEPDGTMGTSEACDIAYYAFGGGMGHVTRAAAILRRLPRVSNLRAVVLTNATVLLPLTTEGITYAHLAETEPNALAARIKAMLDGLRPRLLVMDVFAHGVVGEMAAIIPSLRCAKALVCRHLRRPYSDQLAAAAAGFDLALCVEPPAPRLPIPVSDCSPVLLRDAEEIAPRSEARAILGLQPHQRALVAVSTEDADQTCRLFSLVARLSADLDPAPRLFWASPNLHQFAATAAFARGVRLEHYPLLDLMNGVDLLVGASGYNLFAEAAAVGVPAVFIPRERRYDDQRWRARDAMVAAGAEQLGALLARVLTGPRRTCERASFANAASSAAAQLARLAAGRPAEG